MKEVGFWSSFCFFTYLIYTKKLIKRLGFQNIIRPIFKSELTMRKMLFKSKLLDTTQTSTDNSIIRPICICNDVFITKR